MITSQGGLDCNYLDKIKLPLRLIKRISIFYFWRFKHYIKRVVQPDKYYKDPFEPDDGLYWVNPNRILYVQSQKSFPLRVLTYKDRILDGNWESSNLKFEESLFYKAAFERFIENKKWSTTKYYQTRLEENLENITNKEERKKVKEKFDKRCEEWDNLYETMRVEGYIPRQSIKNDGTNLMARMFDEISVHIGRYGDLYLCQGRHRLAFAKILENNKVPVIIIVRHKIWVDFKNEIFNYMKNNDEKIYRPLTHIDLQYISSFFEDKIFKYIKNNISIESKTLLDIGANWGYYCHKFEDEGFKCFAQENDERNLYFLRKLKRAENKQFTIINESIFTFCDENREFDVILALSVLNNFLKNENTFNRLKELLKKLKMNEMYFLHSPPNNNQKEELYKIFNSEDFVDFILKHSCLTNVELIGYIEDGRPLYKLY